MVATIIIIIAVIIIIIITIKGPETNNIERKESFRKNGYQGHMLLRFRKGWEKEANCYYKQLPKLVKAFFLYAS